MKILLWALGGLVAGFAALIGVIYFDLKAAVTEIKVTIKDQPVLCQTHKDKLNEMIRKINVHERQIIKWKYAVVDCMAVIANRLKTKVEAKDSNGTPDFIEGLP